MFKKILVAYDNGTKSQKALEVATEIAKHCGGEVYIFTSVKMPEYMSSFTGRDMLNELEEKSQEYFQNILEEAEEKVKQEGVPVHLIIKKEKPGEAIVRFAKDENIDLIAMGSHNRGPFERLLLGLGSVSNYVLQNTACPVIITKD